MTCYKCQLASNRKNIVYGIGKYPNNVMIILDYPSYADDKSGIPLTSRIGTKFMKVLQDYELNNAYITYAIKCKPVKGEVMKQDISTCFKYFLYKELNTVNPKFVITLGSISTSLFVKGNLKDMIGNYYNVKNLIVFPYYSIPYININGLHFELLTRIKDIYDKILEL